MDLHWLNTSLMQASLLPPGKAKKVPGTATVWLALRRV